MKKILLLLLSLVWLSASIVRGEEPHKGYRGFVDFALGDAYNFNTNQKISTNNMQWYSMISTTHGYQMKKWFIGGGAGYYHSFRDKENMYPVYAAGRYTFRNVKMTPYVEARAGIIYDPNWAKEKVQKYGALGAGVNAYKRLLVGIRMSAFSRPSRYFTANCGIVISFEI